MNKNTSISGSSETLFLKNTCISGIFSIKRIHEDARIPTRANLLDAGYDISSCEDTIVPAMSRKLISTGLVFYFGDSNDSIPKSSETEDNDGFLNNQGLRTYARIAPRSGLALNRGIDVFAGVIDAGYRGEVKVLLYNSSKNDFVVKKGDKIAQFIIEVILTPEIKELSQETEGSTSRGSKGFGSSGV